MRIEMNDRRGGNRFQFRVIRGLRPSIGAREVCALAALLGALAGCGGLEGEILDAQQDDLRDASAPVVTIRAPSQGQEVSGSLAVTGSAEARARIAGVEVAVDGAGWSQAEGGKSWSMLLDSRQLVDGPHTLTARATDARGNVGSATVTFVTRNGASCGDDSCSGTETCSSCPADCGACAPACGDHSCNGTETCSSCPADCGACAPSCGDRSCSGTETCSSCPADCGACAPACGDHSCNGTETCSSCPADCGACAPACGDHSCNGTETCSSCPADCGTCPTPSGDSCLSRSGPVTTISGVQTSRWDHRSGLPANGLIDARTASWTGTIAYPALAGDGDGLCWHGAKFFGLWSDSTSWDAMRSTAALEWYGGANSIVENMYVQNYGDGLKIKQTADNFTVRRYHARHIKDDCIENDFVRTGTLEDSLLEGCYSGISARPGSTALSGLTEGRNHVYTIENVLLWLEPMQEVYSGTSPNTSGFFKWDKSSYDTSPKVILRNNIFRADMKPADGNVCLYPVAYSPKVIESSGNIIVWTGAGAYPCLPIPEGWTLTTDKSVWDNAVAAWKAAHPGL